MLMVSGVSVASVGGGYSRWQTVNAMRKDSVEESILSVYGGG